MNLVSPRKQVLFIPHWIKCIIERNKLAPTTVLSLATLREFTSLEDLVLLCALNEDNSALFGKQCSFYQPWWSVKNSPGQTGEAEAAVLGQIIQLAPLHKEGLQDRLFNEQTRQEEHPEPFAILDLDENYLLVTIYPGFFGSSDAQLHQRSLTTTLLKALYNYYTYDDLAAHPLFEQYLARL